MISGIIKVSVIVISLSLRLRLITLTSTLIIPDITKTSSNNCLLSANVIHRPTTYFPSNWNILTFFPTFRFVCFILYYFVQAEFFHDNLGFQKEKNFEETLCLQPRQFVFISLHLLLYANYCSSARFRWRQKCRFWIPRCLPFWHRRTGWGGEGGCSSPKFWATQIFWAARENLGKANF